MVARIRKTDPDESVDIDYDSLPPLIESHPDIAPFPGIAPFGLSEKRIKLIKELLHKKAMKDNGLPE